MKLQQLREAANRQRLLKLQQALIELMPDRVDVDIVEHRGMQVCKVTNGNRAEFVSLDDNRLKLDNNTFDRLGAVVSNLYSYLNISITYEYLKRGERKDAVEASRDLEARADSLWSEA